MAIVVLVVQERGNLLIEEHEWEVAYVESDDYHESIFR